MTDWNRIAEKLNDADAVLIGASNGLSITEGLNLFADDEMLYPILDSVKEMAAAEQDGRIPSELIPRCPHCGGPMAVHIAAGPGFIEDTGARQRYNMFLDRYHGKKLAVLELGIGWRNQLIKAPIMRLVTREPQAAYVTVNLGEVYITDDIKDKSFGIDGALSDVLGSLRKACMRSYRDYEKP